MIAQYLGGNGFPHRSDCSEDIGNKEIIVFFNSGVPSIRKGTIPPLIQLERYRFVGFCARFAHAPQNMMAGRRC
jgi:hypothetical protein